jgi:serine phosphatase RsbU (regulator of sigma subunit)
MTLERIGAPLSVPAEASVRRLRAAKRQQVAHDGFPKPAPATRIRHKLHQLSLVVLLVGLVVTGILTASSRLNYLHNEQRLSNLQTNLTASALGIAPVDLERRLGQAAAAAGEASDPVETFRRVISPSVTRAGPFASASLAVVRNGQVQVLVHVGAKPINNPAGNAASALFKRAAKSTSLVTTRVVGKGVQRFGYLMSFVGPDGTYVAAASQALPSSRRVSIPASSPDAGLNIAIYFGKSTSPAALVETNVSHPPLTGTVSRAIVPFGTSVLTLVIAPTSPLAGRWSELLPWGILVVGLLLTFGLVVMTERLLRRRRAAEQLAEENRRLYGEQRNVSLTLQRSLLPKALPTIEGVEFAARYLPGESAIEVGGDWYSAIAIDDHRFAFVVGDVSGRGLAAATIMAGLRYTIRAYAAIGYTPARILQIASKEIDIESDGHFATVLVGLVDNDRSEVTMANAGHLPALLLNSEQSEFIEVPVGLPLGIGAPVYDSLTIPLAPNSTLIAYTDGLVERRNEAIDAGMERLRTAASVDYPSVDDLLTSIVDTFFAEYESDDDTAILAIRWLDRSRNPSSPYPRPDPLTGVDPGRIGQ